MHSYDYLLNKKNTNKIFFLDFIFFLDLENKNPDFLKEILKFLGENTEIEILVDFELTALILLATLN